MTRFQRRNPETVRLTVLELVEIFGPNTVFASPFSNLTHMDDRLDFAHNFELRPVGPDGMS